MFQVPANSITTKCPEILLILTDSTCQETYLIYLSVCKMHGDVMVFKYSSF